MTTTLTLLRQRCGLSQREAAAFLNVKETTVQSWDSGRRQAPPGAIDQLRGLYAEIEGAAAQAADKVSDMHPDVVIEIGLSSDDHEAAQLGLPCVGAHEALLGLVAARLSRPVRIVARGATPATAAAIEAREGR